MSKERLLKEGYMKMISRSSLPPKSWQIERHDAGVPFYEFVYEPNTVKPQEMEVIPELHANSSCAQAEQVGHIALTQPLVVAEALAA